MICSRALVPGGQRADTGSQSSHSAKTSSSATLVTNSGTTATDRPPAVMIRSAGFPACKAANTPPTIDSGTTRMNASAASFIEFLKPSKTMVLTGRS